MSRMLILKQAATWVTNQIVASREFISLTPETAHHVAIVAEDWRAGGDSATSLCRFR
jgi:hypothetical protein